MTQVRGCSQIMSAKNRGVQFPPPPFVTHCTLEQQNRKRDVIFSSCFVYLFMHSNNQLLSKEQEKKLFGAGRRIRCQIKIFVTFYED